MEKETRDSAEDYSTRQASEPRESGEIINHDEETADVVVIGAGWAGLAAAKALKKRGDTRVAILEARDYIGGRSVTTYELGPDIPVDLGSAWIHGKRKNPVQIIAEQNSVPHATVRETFAVWDNNGRTLNKREMDKLIKYKSMFMKYMEKRQKRDRSDKSLQQVVDDFMKVKSIPDGNVGRRGLQWLIDAEITQEYAAALSELSLWWWDIDEELSGGDVYLAVPNGGYSALINKFALPVMPSIRLRSKVTRIEYGKGMAKVCYVDGSTGNAAKIMAKHVLVTLPLGVLKARSVEFFPPLPPAKLKAIGDLGTGIMNKCVLFWEGMQKEDVFWPEDKEWLMRITPSGEQGKWTEFYNPYSMNGGKPVLFGFVVGDHASRIENLSDEDVAAEVVAALRNMFGVDKVPEPTRSIVTRWGSDRFAHCSYSFQKVGSNQESRAELAKPVSNQIWFAGEATDIKYPGTTHGALLSGERAARNIWGVFGKEKKNQTPLGKLFSASYFF